MKRVVAFVALIVLLSGCSVKKVEDVTDSEKFAQEYDVSKNNPMIYVNYDKLMKLFEEGSNIIFLADSDYEGSSKAAQLLLQEAKKQKVEKIYYYNPKKLEEKSPKKYKKLINKLKDFLEKEEEEYILNLPDIYSLKDGKIMNHSNYFSKEEELSEEHFTKKVKEEVRNKYQEIITFKECIECD